MVPQVHLEIEDSDILLADLRKVVESGWLSEGPFSKRYLELAQKRLGIANVLPVSNGTLGLLLAFLAAQRLWTVGDVLVPSFTFYGTVTPMVPLGFNPVFVDCSVDSFQSELSNYKEAATSRTVGIVLVHIFGQVGQDTASVVEWARSEGYFIIEDAAQAFGAETECQKAGSFGDISVFSTYSDKALPTGEGGLICSKDDEVFNLIRLLRNQGRPNSGTFLHPEFGMNFRITDLQAAIGAHLLARYDCELARRRLLYEEYLKQSEHRQIRTMKVSYEKGLVPFRFPVVSRNREASMARLEREGYQTRGFFTPLHCQPKFKRFGESLPGAEHISQHGICLPVHKMITEIDIKKQLACIE
jgi:perosamine synthetase